MTQLGESEPRFESQLASTEGVRSQSTVVADLVQMAKPRLTMMVLITALVGFGMGVTYASDWTWWQLFATLIGTGLSCVGAGIFNQIVERDTDALMHRTQDRPLPTGRMTPGRAMAFALTFCLLGVLTLAAGANLLAASISAITIVSYALIYTPMKRISSLSTVVGAVPGALPPVIGFTAAANDMLPAGWILFGILFLWQLPHFLAIAWLYREDYARANMPLLPVLEPDGGSTFRQMVLGCLALLPLGLLPTVLGLSGMIYFTGALAAGLLFLGCAVMVMIRKTTRDARRMFLASLVYLPVVFTLMFLDAR